MADNASKLKSFQDIRINVTRYEAGRLQVNSQPANLTMADKLNEYITKAGHTNAHIYNIALRLLIKGKVRVDFKSYMERLTLVDPSDKMYRKDAIAMIDKFLAGVHKDGQNEGTDRTQKIVLNF